MIREVDAEASDATRRFYREKAGHLLRVLGAVQLAELTRDDVLGYIERRTREKAARSTIAKELIALRRTLEIARLRGDTASGPKDVIPPYSVDYQPRRRWLDVRSAARLLSEIPDQRRMWVALALFAGARRSEVEGVRWEHVDLAGRQIFIPGTKTQRAERWVPLMPELEDLLRADALARRPAPSSYVVEHWGNVGRDLPAACARAGLAHVSPNDLRRTFASWLKQRGVDSLHVARLLGHSSTRMVELVYGQLDSATLRAAVDAMPAVDVPPPRKQRGRQAPCVTGVSDSGEPGGLAGRGGKPDPAKSPRNSVPRGGIEPPTRGFSARESKAANAEIREVFPRHTLH
jgi:integrase